MRILCVIRADGLPDQTRGFNRLDVRGAQPPRSRRRRKLIAAPQPASLIRLIEGNYARLCSVPIVVRLMFRQMCSTKLSDSMHLSLCLGTIPLQINASLPHVTNGRLTAFISVCALAGVGLLGTNSPPERSASRRRNSSKITGNRIRQFVWAPLERIQPLTIDCESRCNPRSDLLVER